MTFETLIGKVEDAISCIYKKESFLIKEGLSEWTISAQFYYYMRRACQSLQRGYNFDSEYNFMSKVNDKELARKYICVDGSKLRVRPDFIIHKRGNPKGNFLWVEMKRKGGVEWESDKKRVKAVTQEMAKEGNIDYVTGYVYGLGVLFRKKEVLCHWFSKNEEKFARKMILVSDGETEWINQ